MPTDNLALWQSLERTDPSFTKAFTRGGGFSGTAVNGTYLVRRLTERFGPCGIGWGYEVLEESMLEGAQLQSKNGEIARELVHCIKLLLWYKLGDERGDVIHYGQTTFVGANRHGIYTDEEAPKKSLTDALGKAASMIGVAADVHLGRYDDSKYVAEVRRAFATEQPQAACVAPSSPPNEAPAAASEAPAVIEAAVAKLLRDKSRVRDWVSACHPAAKTVKAVREVLLVLVRDVAESLETLDVDELVAQSTGLLTMQTSEAEAQAAGF